MNYLFFNLLAAKRSHTFSKIEYELYSDKELLQSGRIDPESPECTYNFIMFLLCVCESDLIISHNLNFKLKIIGEEMKRRGLFTDKKNTPHLDLREKFPNCKCAFLTVSEMSTVYFNQINAYENTVIDSA